MACENDLLTIHQLIPSHCFHHPVNREIKKTISTSNNKSVLSKFRGLHGHAKDTHVLNALKVHNVYHPF